MKRPILLESLDMINFRYDHVSRSTSGHSNSGSTSNATRKQPLAPSQKIRRTGLHSWFGSNPQLPWRTESESAGRRREDSEYSASRSLSQSSKSKEWFMFSF